MNTDHRAVTEEVRRLQQKGTSVEYTRLPSQIFQGSSQGCGARIKVDGVRGGIRWYGEGTDGEG